MKEQFIKEKAADGRNQTEVAKKLSDIAGRLKSNLMKWLSKKLLENLCAKGFWCLKRVR